MRANMDAARAQGEHAQPYYEMLQQLGLAGQAFGQDAIVATIFLDTGTGQNSLQADLAVLSMPVDGMTAPLAITTGRRALALVNPNTTEVLYSGAILSTTGDVVLAVGQATAADFVGPRPIAVVVGWQGAGQRLVAVDLTDPRQPRALGSLDLPAGTLHRAGGLLLRDGIVYLGGTTQTTMVSLADPAQPRIVGTLAGGGFLAISDTNILLSSGHFYEPARKLRSSALEAVAAITRVTMTGLTYNEAAGTDQTEREVRVEFRVIPDRYAVENATVEIARAGVPVSTLNATVSGAGGTALWPAGTVVDRLQNYTARVTVNPQAERPLASVPAPIPLVEWVFVNQRGEETHAPLESDPRPVVTLMPVQSSDVTFSPQGQAALVRIRGEVTDPIADITAEQAADIREVEIEGHRIPVTPIPQPVTPWRPHAFRGRFEATVTVDVADGRNVILAKATNAIGGRGYDSVTLNVVQTYPPLPEPANLLQGEGVFQVPFTLVAGTLRPDASDSIVFYRGGSQPTGTEPQLFETAENSNLFEGTMPELGAVSVHMAAASGPDSGRTVRAMVTVPSLGLEATPLDFARSSAASSVFRSPLRQMPSGRPLSLVFDRLPDPSLRDQVRAAVSASEEADMRTMTESALDSAVFLGPLVDGEEGTLEVLSLDTVAAQFGRLRALVTTSSEGSEPLFLELVETAPGSLRFVSDVGSAVVESPSPTLIPTSTQLVSVQQNDSVSPGSVEPVFAVIKGLSRLPVGTVAALEGRSLDLTASPIPLAQGTGPSVASQARTVRPVVFVTERETEMTALPPSVLPVAQTGGEILGVAAAAASAQPARRSRVYRFTATANGATVESFRSGAAASRPFVAVRGTSTRLDFVYLNQPDIDVRLIDVTVTGGGVTCTIAQQFLGNRGGSSHALLDVWADRNAALGARTLTFRYRRAGRVIEHSVERALLVTRGRMVVFAIDGLSTDQFDAATRSLGPPLGRTTKPAFSTIFDPSDTRKWVKRTEIATFPPITFTRWATVFSGRTPKETMVPSLNWFNRQALVDGTGGRVNQFIGEGDRTIARKVLFDSDSYNRHHRVPFVYDTIGENGLRSVVVMQQAGVGQRRGQNNAEWIRASLGGFGFLGEAANIFALGGLVAERESVFLDEVSTSRAEREILARGEDFDLMVVYLSGLDHYLHMKGERCEGGEPCGDRFFRLFLHGRINRIVETLGPLQAGTVFGVFSDHGHVSVDPDAFMAMDASGPEVPAQPSMRDTLAKSGPGWFVGDHYFPATRLGAPNVIFTPQFAMAHVYVASNAGRPHLPTWTAPPSLNLLQAPVRRIYEQYVQPAGDDWSRRPLAAILVRDPEGSSVLGAGRYKVFDPIGAGCTDNRTCSLAQQLLPLETLKGMGPEPFAVGDIWAYRDPERRVNAEFSSANSGDIVLLANVRSYAHGARAGKPGFQFQEPYRYAAFRVGGYASQHGSLSEADARVPVAFGTIGAAMPTGDEDLIGPLRQFFASLPPLPEVQPGMPESPGIPAALEVPAMLRFFLNR
jgi:hypothetical protein